jgi:hypothetical protein
MLTHSLAGLHDITFIREVRSTNCKVNEKVELRRRCVVLCLNRKSGKQPPGAESMLWYEQLAIPGRLLSRKCIIQLTDKDKVTLTHFFCLLIQRERERKSGFKSYIRAYYNNKGVGESSLLMRYLVQW